MAVPEGTGVPAPDPVPSLAIEKTPAPGFKPRIFRLGPPRRFTGIAPGAGEEAIVGGEEGGKGDSAAMGLVSITEAGGREETWSLMLEEDEFAVAVRRACGGNFRRTRRDGREPELRRDVGGEEASMSIAH